MLNIIPKTLLAVVLFSIAVLAQESMSLQQCFDAVNVNYPLIKQKNLIGLTKEYNVTNAWRGYLPQMSVSLQATYQSEVTEVPIKLPGVKIESADKDQYKSTLDIMQTVYDGGVISTQAALHELTAESDLQKNEIDMRKIREQAQQLFFGLLIIDQQLAMLKLTQSDVQAALNKITAASVQGAATKNDIDILQAEQLKTIQRQTELQANRNAYNDMLCLLTGKRGTLQPVTPVQPELQYEKPLQRPELKLFDIQGRMVREQKDITLSKILPKLSLFGQVGYSKPGLNMLKSEFNSYYLAGVKASWNLSGFYTNANEKEVLDINERTIDIQREVFLLATGMQLKQQIREAEKQAELVKTDDEIMQIRERIKNTAMAQLAGGVITSNDFVRELNQFDTARQNKLLHQVQLNMALYAIEMTTGN